MVHSVECAQRRLDFTEFNTVSANLDLLIGPAQILQLSVVAPRDQVPGAIHAGTGLPEGACHKAGGRQIGTTDVSGGDALTGHIQFSDDAGRHRLHPRVQHEERRAGYRRANGDGGIRRPCHQRRTDRHAHRGLRRTVRVDHHPPGSPPLHDRGRARLTDHRERRGLQVFRGKHGHSRRSLRKYGDLFGDQHVVEVRG